MFCGTESGEIYKSIDHGENWTNVSLTLTFLGHPYNVGVRTIAIHPTNPNIVYFSAGKVIGKSINGGQTWSYVYDHGSNWWNFNAEKILIHPTNPDKIYVATKQGLIISNNGGSSWITVFNNPTYDICFKPSSPNTLYVLRKNPTTDCHEFLKSTNAGISFQTMTSGWYNSTDPDRETIGGRIAVSAADPNRVYAYLIGESKANDGGFIGLYKSTNSGSSWTLPNGPTGGPYSMSHPNLANALILGNGHHQGLYNCALLASNTNADHILIGGSSIWKSEDGGLTFTVLGGYSTGLLNDAIHVGPFHVDMQDFNQTSNTTWVTTDGGIYKSNDFFSSTNFWKKDYGIHSMDIWGLGQGWNQDVLFSGAYHNGNIAFYENWGQGNSLALGGGEPATGYINPGENKRVYSSDIKGHVLPENIGDPIETFNFGINPNESYYTLGTFSELEFHPETYRVAYTGKDHELWKTNDKGESFELLHSFGTDTEDKVTFIEISRNDPDIMFVSQQHSTSFSSSLHKTINGGLTWTSVNLPSDANLSRKITIQVDPFNPNHIYLGFNYPGNRCKIFRSINGGSSWTDLTTSTIADEPLNTLTYIPGTNNSLYIGTDEKMFYKNDNLSDWVCFSDNLPPVTHTLHAKPFYRDGKIRIATFKGIWESPLYEEPSEPFAQASVDYLSSHTRACINDTLHFVDHSILNHQNASWNWFFGADATPTSSTNWQEKVVFNTPGDHEVILEVTNGNGFTDRDTLIIEVNNMPSLDQTFEEGFEFGIPEQAFRTINHGGDNITWHLIDSVGGYGLSNQCIGINGYYASAGEKDDIEFDINLSNIDSPMVTFDVAYARYSGGYTDTLEVLISTDCGEHFQSLYLKGNADLATAPDTNSPFSPTSDQWRTDTVDLIDYTSYDQLLLVFRDHEGWGQNMFLDNINLNGEDISTVGIQDVEKSNIIIYPNPVHNNQAIHINGPKNATYKVEIFSSSGKLVYSKLNIKSSSFTPSNLASGSYFYRISSEKLIKHGVLIKKD